MANTYDELGQLLSGETEEEDPNNPGFIKHVSPDGSYYYTPKPGYVPQQPEATTGTPLEQAEIPIPRVSLPDVPKEDVPAKKTAPVYEVTPDEPVPETPAEQLEKLKPPVDQPTIELDPWAAAADRTRRGVVRDRPKTEPEQPPEPDNRSFVDKATAPLRYGASTAYEQLGNLVYGLPGAVTDLLATIEEKTPSENVPISGRRTGGIADYSGSSGMREVSDALKEANKIFKRGVEQATFTEGQKPKTPLEKGAYWTGEYFMPAKGVTLAATTGLAATGAAIRGSLTKFGPEDIPIPGVTPAAAVEWPDPSKGNVGITPPTKVTPGAPPPQPPPNAPPVKVAPAPKAPVTPKPVVPGSIVIPPSVPPPAPPSKPLLPGYAPAPAPAPVAPPAAPAAKGKEGKEKRTLKYTDTPAIPPGMFPGDVVPPPHMRRTAPPTIKQHIGRLNKKGERVGAESDEAYARRFENAWIYKEIQARMYSESAVETFQGIHDMIQRAQKSEYRVLGDLGAIMIGLAFGPKVLKGLRKGEVPVFRSVKDAVEGTMAISKPSDLARAYGDDLNAALTRIAARAGMHPDAIKRVQELFRIQSRNGARALAESAINGGKMTTPSFKFEAPVSLRELEGLVGQFPEADKYLHLLRTRDLLLDRKNTLVERASEKFRGARPVSGKGAPTGVYRTRAAAEETRIQGTTIKEVEQQIADMEAANPALTKIKEANQAWNKEMTRFLESGEFSTLTKEQADNLRMSHTNALEGKFGAPAIRGQAEGAQKLIKERLDNEAIGRYIDEMRKVDDRLFVKVDPKTLSKEDFARFKDNMVGFKRNGVEEFYTTDPLIADILKSDYHIITSEAGNIFYATKRVLEATTTGNLAPHFSVTSALRSYWIAKFTTEEGFRAPTSIGSILAIPQQLLPQLSKFTADVIRNSKVGEIMDQWALQPGWSEGLAKRLTAVYDESVFAQIKTAGSHRGSVLEHQQRSVDMEKIGERIDEAVANSPKFAAAKTFWEGWKATIEAIHNAPSFNFIKRNLGVEGDAELALRARRLTGDPRTGGGYYSHTGKPIRFESDNRSDQLTADTLVRLYGMTMEGARSSIPWWNATLQGAKRIGEAYITDPMRFTMAVTKYALAPAAGMFYYAKALDAMGGDPNGKSYLDWCLNGRSAYNRQMNFCVPIPGRPVQDSAEVSFFHELNPFKRGMETVLHHLIGSDFPKEHPLSFFLSMPDNQSNPNFMTARDSLTADLWKMAHAFLDTAVIPPTPPLLNAFLGTMGIRGPQGLIGPAFTVKTDPFNQNGGLPTNLEITTRSLFGVVAESLGQFYHNATQTEGGIPSQIINGMRGVRDTYVKKTPFLRDAMGYTTGIGLPDTSNNTDLAKDVWDHQKAINDLARNYKKWVLNEGRINVDPASKAGGIVVNEQYGLKQLGPGNPGLDQRPPDNPIYNEFMDTFYRRFMKESPNLVKGQDEGGIAFKSLFRNYGQATQKLERLKDVNYGSYDRWQRDMDQDARDELTAAGIDPTNRRDVVNFYRQMQYDALRVIHYVRRATEDTMSDKATAQARATNPNAPRVTIRLKDLKPYLSMSEQPSGFMFPGLLEEFGGTGPTDVSGQ